MAWFRPLFALLSFFNVHSCAESETTENNDRENTIHGQDSSPDTIGNVNRLCESTSVAARFVWSRTLFSPRPDLTFLHNTELRSTVLLYCTKYLFWNCTCSRLHISRKSNSTCTTRQWPSDRTRTVRTHRLLFHISNHEW